MSNRLLNATKRVTHACGRKLRASEKAVLFALADDARDHLGGRSKLTTREICTITGLSPRAVGLAYPVLAKGGLITREAGAPGAPIVSLVHPDGVKNAPIETVVSTARIATPVATFATPGGNNCQGSIVYKDITIDQGTTGARAPEVVSDEVSGEVSGVDQVFEAWDTMAASAGLPGPVARDAARTVAIEEQLAAHGLWRVLRAVRAVGESDFLRGRRRASGQGDWRADFDWVFEVRHFRGSAHFTKLLEGNYGRAVPVLDAASADGTADSKRTGTAEQLDPRLRGLAGPHEERAWLAGLVIEEGPGGSVLRARSAFEADYVRDKWGRLLAERGLDLIVSQGHSARERV